MIPAIVPFLTKFFEILGKGAGAIPVVIGYISDLVESFTKAFDLKVPPGGGIIEQLAKSIMSGLGKLLDAGKKIATTIFEGIASGMSSGSVTTASNLVAGGLMGGVILAIRKLMKNGLDIDLTGGLMKNINNAFGQLTGTLKSMQQEVKAKMIMEIAIAVAVLAASVIALSFIDGKDIAKSMAGLATGLGLLLGSMVLLDKMSGTMGYTKIPIIAASMILLAGSLLVLSLAIAVMAHLSWEQMIKGLVGISAALLIIAGAMAIMPKNMPWIAAGLLLVGTALVAIASALTIMSFLSLSDIGSGLATTAGALTVIALAMRGMPPTLPLTAAGLVLVGFALGEIGAALKLMGTMSWDDIAKGLTALGGSLALLAIGLNLMSGTLLGSASLMVAAGAIAIFVPSLLLMAHLSWEEIAKGMVGLAGGLVILGLAMYAMTGAVAGALALMVIAPALIALALALQVLGKMSWSQLAIALVALAAGLTVLGIAGVLIEPAIPGLLGLGAALLLVGAGLAFAGAGVWLFAKGLSALVDLGGKAIGMLTDYIMGFVELLPVLGKGFANLLVMFAKTVAKNAPALISEFVKMLGDLIDKANTLLPKLGKLMVNALKTVVEVVKSNLPMLVNSGSDIVIALINGLSSRIGGIVTAAVNLIIAFAKGIESNTVRMAQAGVNLITKFLHDLASVIRGSGGAIGGGIADVVDAMHDVGVQMVQGLIGGVGSMVTEAIGSVASIAHSMVSEAKNIFKQKSPSKVFYDIGKFVVKGLTKGIQDHAVAAVNAVASMVSNQVAIANEYISQYIQKLDQKALAARGRAEGLAGAAKLAADEAQKQANAAEKTKKNKDDDKKARRATKAAESLGRVANKADQAAKQREAASARAKAKQDRDQEYADADTIGKARMRSEDAQNAAANAMAAEKKAQAKQTEAAVLEQQAKNKNLSAKARKDLLAEAARDRKDARAAAQSSNAWITRARAAASDAMRLQAQAGAEAAASFDAQYAADAKAAADADAFDKMTIAEKAAERRRQATELQAQADKDLANAKTMAYTDLEEANRLAELALNEADQARSYLRESQDYDTQEAARIAQGATETPDGTVINLDPTEAAGFEFNKYSDLYGSAYAAAAASGPSVEFYQYNTSPESLSPTEVYRQTHNLITYAAGRVAA